MDPVAPASPPIGDRRDMADQRRGDRGRDRGPEPERPRNEPRRDPGAYIGRLPERATETIPGEVRPKDVRVAAVASQPAPVRGELPGTDSGEPPEGHREGENASDDRIREAGKDR